MKRLLAVLLISGTAVAARAEDRRPRAHIGLYPGKAVMVNRTREAQADAFAVYWSLDYDLTRALSLGFDLGYIDTSKVQNGVTGSGLSSDVDTGFFQLTGNAKFFRDFGGDSFRWRPYAAVGGGWYQTFGRTRTVTASNPPVKTTIRAKTRPGVQAGAGIRTEFASHWGLAFDARFHSVLGRNEKPFQFLSLNGGLTFSFG